MPVSSIIDHKYRGFLNTPSLFQTPINGFSLFEFPRENFVTFRLPDTFTMPVKIRLGQQMEYFMEALLRAKNYTIIAKNLQIIVEKQTLGEFDFILKTPDHNKLLHLELAYKFYLYDPEVSGHWTQKCIGANRSDSLFQKLKKLKDRQFPLLYDPESAGTLHAIGVEVRNCEQQLCLKGQLFLPFNYSGNLNGEINKKAVAGLWVRLNSMKEMNWENTAACIPLKNDWIISPEEYHGNWFTIETLMTEIEDKIIHKRSVLLWVRKGNSIQRVYVVWW